MDDERQRSLRGKRRRYFLAAALRREHDGRIKRWRLARQRSAGRRARLPGPDKQEQPPAAKLSLPVPTFVPLIQPSEDSPGTKSV